MSHVAYNIENKVLWLISPTGKKNHLATPYDLS